MYRKHAKRTIYGFQVASPELPAKLCFVRYDHFRIMRKATRQSQLLQAPYVPVTGTPARPSMGVAKLPHKRRDTPAGKQVLRARCVKHAENSKTRTQ